MYLTDTEQYQYTNTSIPMLSVASLDAVLCAGKQEWTKKKKLKERVVVERTGKQRDPNFFLDR